MRRIGVVVLLVLIAGCGSSGSGPSVSHASFRSDVRAAYQPVSSTHGDPADKYETFAAAVESMQAPADEVGQQDRVVSAAKTAAAVFRADAVVDSKNLATDLATGSVSGPDLDGVVEATTAVRQAVAALPKS